MSILTVQEVITEINKIKADSKKTGFLLLLQVISVINIVELEELMNGWILNLPITKYALQLKEILEKNANAIKFTPASYLNNPLLPINRIYALLAEKLSRDNLSFYKLLIPSLNSSSLSNIQQDSLVSTIIADDGSLINIQDCLHRAALIAGELISPSDIPVFETQGDVLKKKIKEDAAKMMYPLLYRDDSLNKPVSEQESQRIVYSSQTSQDYYFALERSALTIKQILWAEEEVAFNQEVKEIQATQITKSDGERSNRLLREYILSRVKDYDQKKLIQVMLALDQKNWMNFLDLIDGDLGVLQDILFKESTLAQALAKRDNKIIDETQAKALLLCFTRIYFKSFGKLPLKDIPEHEKTVRQWLLDRYLKLAYYTASEREEALQHLSSFLCNDQGLNTIEQYFQNKKKEKYYKVLLNDFGSLMALLNHLQKSCEAENIKAWKAYQKKEEDLEKTLSVLSATNASLNNSSALFAPSSSSSSGSFYRIELA